MAPTRREFLIIAGLSAISSACPPLGRIIAKETTSRGTHLPGAPGITPALKAKRWAMVVDANKCCSDCTDCMTACHEAHNVPAIANLKHEIKWIWPERLENVFPAESHAHIQENVRKKIIPVLCN